nr:putative reverse transcriptase domain-containing protein [Tanacetum cinerariifolium]
MKKIFQILHIGRGMEIFSLRLFHLGLSNAPAVFTDLMNRVCKPYLDKFFIVIIIDILIYSKSKEGHEAHLKLVLELRKKDKLFAKFSKCEFWLREVHFLRHVVNSDKIHMDSSKIEAMKNWKVPKTPSEIRTFLGLAGVDKMYHDLRDMYWWPESLRDAIGYEYGLSSLDGWTMSPVLWAEIGEIKLIGPELMQETTDKVVLTKKKLKAVRDRQKSYADNRRKPLEFEVGDQVLLKVSPLKGVIRFGKKADANLHVHLKEIKVDITLRFVEEPVEIIDREVKSLKRSRILIVKVHWNSKRDPEEEPIEEEPLKEPKEEG